MRSRSASCGDPPGSALTTAACCRSIREPSPARRRRGAARTRDGLRQGARSVLPAELSWAMANDRGVLPKAKREELTEHLQRQLERWYRNAYEDDNLFLTMARRPGLLDATWGFIRYIYGGGSSVEPELFELVRVKLAWNNRCVH